MGYPVVLSDLINYFKKFPGIGEKSAERMALSLLDFPIEDVLKFSDSMVNAKKKLHPCPICGHLTENELCDICSDQSRNKSIICILEDYNAAMGYFLKNNDPWSRVVFFDLTFLVFYESNEGFYGRNGLF